MNANNLNKAASLTGLDRPTTSSTNIFNGGIKNF